MLSNVSYKLRELAEVLIISDKMIKGYVKKDKEVDVGGKKIKIKLWYTKTPHGLRLIDQKSDKD